MPYTPKAHRFFALCATHPEKASGKCPPKKQARKMMGEGVKKAGRKKRMMPRKDANGFY